GAVVPPAGCVAAGGAPCAAGAGPFAPQPIVPAAATPSTTAQTARSGPDMRIFIGDALSRQRSRPSPCPAWGASQANRAKAATLLGTAVPAPESHVASIAGLDYPRARIAAPSRTPER